MNIRHRMDGFTLVELVVVIGLIGVLMSLLLPAVQAAREAARRTQCVSQMSQLALGVLAYEAAHEMLPPGSVNATGPIANGPPGYHHSWIVQVLPHIDQAILYGQVNFDLGVYDIGNATATGVSLRQLLCPSSPFPWKPMTPPCSYVGNHHHDEAPIHTTNSGLLFLNSHIRLDDVADGRAQTILLGERRPSTGELGWASGTSSTLRNGGQPLNKPVPAPTLANADPVGGFGCYHPGGANFAFADGHIGFVKSSTSRLGVLQPMLNRGDGLLFDEVGY